MASAASNYNKTLVQIQKLANNSAKSIQSMINKSNKEQMTFNSAEAEKSRSWQEKMSKSSHQMEVADLKKAGLNPILSVNSGGAQSYTTSSASTQNDSGASASAAILSDQLGAMSNMESARMSSDATMKAADQTAKANRYAAQQSAAAQKYASDQAYKLGVYRANLEYKSQQEQRTNQRWIATHATANSYAGMFDKLLNNTPLTKKGIQIWKETLFGNKTTIGSQLYTGKVKLTSKNSHLNEFNEPCPNKGTSLYRRMNTALYRMGVPCNDDNRGLLWRAVVKRDHKALKYLGHQVYTSKNNDPFKLRPGYR